MSKNHEIIQLSLNVEESREHSVKFECRNLVKVRWFFDGWLSKNVKEENNIGIEEIRKDLMEDGI